MALNKVADLAALRQEMESDGGILRLLVDHPDQIHYLESFENTQTNQKRWSVFIKIDGGQRSSHSLSLSYEIDVAETFLDEQASQSALLYLTSSSWPSSTPPLSVSTGFTNMPGTHMHQNRSWTQSSTY